MITKGHLEEGTQQEVDLKSKIEERCKQENVLLKHKSKIHWLKEGEHNATFFHKFTIHHIMHNIIASLRTTNGSRVEKHEDIEHELLSFYQDILTKSTSNRAEGINLVTNHIPYLIFEDQNETFMRQVTLQEVDQAVTQVAIGKVLGLDGFMINFFHHYWDILKNDI